MKRKGSIMKNFNVMIALLISTVIIFQIIAVFLGLVFMKKQNQIQEELIIVQCSNYITTRIDYLTNLFKIVSNSSDLIEYVQSNDEPKLKQKVADKIFDIQKIDYSNIINMVFFDNNNVQKDITNNISYSKQKYIKEEFNNYIKSASKDELSETGSLGFFYFEENKLQNTFFYLISPIKYYDFNTLQNVVAGYSMMFILTDLTSLYSKIDINNIEAYLVSGNKKLRIINKGNVGNHFTESNIDGTIFGTSWRLEGSFETYIDYIWNIIFIVLFAETIMLLILMYIFKKNITKRLLLPLSKIIDFLKESNFVSKTNNIAVVGNTEIVGLANSINKMSENNKTLARKIFKTQQKAFEYELLNRESTLNMLKYQINPHTLYNTFELIRSISVVYNVPEIEKITMNFAEIMRYNLKNNETTAISNELIIGKRFLEIMDIKYNSEFLINYNIDEEILNVSIIKAVFQPIIENVFKHGYKRRGTKFTININGYRLGNLVLIEFLDNGVGISTEKMEEITRLLNNEISSENNVGLHNVNSRLKIMYGKEFGIKVESNQNEYTKVTVIIPYNN